MYFRYFTNQEISQLFGLVSNVFQVLYKPGDIAVVWIGQQCISGTFQTRRYSSCLNWAAMYFRYFTNQEILQLFELGSNVFQVLYKPEDIAVVWIGQQCLSGTLLTRRYRSCLNWAAMYFRYFTNQEISQLFELGTNVFQVLYKPGDIAVVWIGQQCISGTFQTRRYSSCLNWAAMSFRYFTNQEISQLFGLGSSVFQVLYKPGDIAVVWIGQQCISGTLQTRRYRSCLDWAAMYFRYFTNQEISQLFGLGSNVFQVLYIPGDIAVVWIGQQCISGTLQTRRYRSCLDWAAMYFRYFTNQEISQLFQLGSNVLQVLYKPGDIAVVWIGQQCISGTLQTRRYRSCFYWATLRTVKHVSSSRSCTVLRAIIPSRWRRMS